MSEMIIRDCHALVPSETGPLTILFHQDIFIEGNKITAIQPTGANNPRPGVEVVEANQMLAIPGLINTHAHVPMVIFRGLAEDVSIERWFNEFMWPLENNLTPDDVYWGMMLGLVEMIEGGVTTVADHYFFMDHAARAVEQAGTRAALGWQSLPTADMMPWLKPLTLWNGGRDRRKAELQPGWLPMHLTPVMMIF
jgi:5-methylthioadenosine/S-adenosylhomocysteine deaminase